MSKKKYSTVTLMQACEAMIHSKQAAGLSPNTINDYRVTFKKLPLFFPQDIQFCSIKRSDLEDFFVWLQDEYISEPDGVAPRGSIKLSAKTVKNIHTNLSSLWSWGVENEIVPENIVRKIPTPRASDPVIIPYTKDEVAGLIKACDRTTGWKSRQHVSNKRSTSDRDKALILFLLDTGVRASEAGNICIADVNFMSNSVVIRGKGPGRDPKERIVQFGRITNQALQKMLLPRMNALRPNDPLFIAGVDVVGRPITRTNLGLLLRRIGKRASISKVHPHRFRHTFAINFLRNGGNVFELQKLLGHEDLQTVLIYLKLAQVDLEAAHQRASPVDNWRLPSK